MSVDRFIGRSDSSTTPSATRSKAWIASAESVLSSDPGKVTPDRLSLESRIRKR